jgi:hypothetical protein
MPVTPPVTPPPPLQYRALDLCADALIEIGAVAPGEVNNIPQDELLWTFRKLNEVIDVWQAMRNKVYSYQFLIFTFNAGVNPVLMGPSPVAQWAVPQRPVRLESAALILNFSIPVDLPINIRDKDWWALNQVKSIQTNVPTDVYPDYTWPDASLYFWPVINVNDQVRLQVWTTVNSFVSITDPIGGPGGPYTLPPAYRTALKLTLAESLLSGSNKQPSPTLSAAATIARAAMIGPNAPPPRISTQDSGMPRGGNRKGDFNYFSGGRPGGPPQ